MFAAEVIMNDSVSAPYGPPTSVVNAGNTFSTPDLKMLQAQYMKYSVIKDES